jgi:hypothetical protein
LLENVVNQFFDVEADGLPSLENSNILVECISHSTRDANSHSDVPRPPFAKTDTGQVIQYILGEYNAFSYYFKWLMCKKRSRNGSFLSLGDFCAETAGSCSKAARRIVIGRDWRVQACYEFSGLAALLTLAIRRCERYTARTFPVGLR